MCRRRFELRTPILKGWCSSCWTNGTERGDGITMATIKPRKLLVPLTGLEPVRILLRGILSPLCLPIPPQRLFNFYKYSNIFYRNCQDFYWLGWLDSNQRNDGVKVRCLTPWLHPIFYKYYIIFYNICQDFYWRKWEDSNLWTPFGVSPLARECFIATQPHFQLSMNIISYFRIFVNL